MSNARNILPECYADTLLVEILGYKKPNHQLSIGQVFKTMEKKMGSKLAIGVTDRDKKITANYYKSFQEEAVENGVRKLKNGSKQHYLIEHIPLEKFLFQAAEDVGINPASYGFSTLRELMQATKKQNIGNNQRFKQFLNTLHQKKAPGLMTIKKWLKELLGEIY